MAPPGSQAAPLPSDLPFRLISRTIGTGAYAFIRKACPLTASKPVIAVKFINKEHAFRNGKLRPKQLQMEIMLHKHLACHKNIIEFFGHGEDAAYMWIAMELADGGDLFDKIEADAGVGEDIAHFYFTQLMSAVGYMHSKGVAHRDLKPENVLVSADGNLKLADFGLAALFMKDGQMRMCNTVCGSPPYIAPEIVDGKRSKRAEVLETGYAPNIADIWSCGVVLFVLLVGNTPWDEPTMRSYEFKEYVDTGGRTTDELWEQLPQGVPSLLRGMLKLDPNTRFTLDEIRTHPWFTRNNPHLSPTGTAANPVSLATQMLESLRIDFHSRVPPEAMDVQFASTQPEPEPQALEDMDWERPPRMGFSASQPTAGVSRSLLDSLSEDPSLSQFTQTPAVPMSLTQAARRFGDIVPAHTLARFMSALPVSLLVPLVVEALHRLGVPARAQEADGQVFIRVKTIDGRSQGLNGTVIVEQWNGEVCEVRFVKAKGDPLEWRRFFKKVCALCKDAILVPN
ncbi:serine/threonine-protein kinase-like protein chk1 [Trichodelitschia bisporula]|uniref:non-specific serine/threonine protein kinase n=1 Tax=Trichodelitschia bisporula TaxID=703511 RepID=A0A6G1HTK2_9PEZI|nr:serine/threonine-protein kinase-like protein chk1 [Trichodelitschia bisporula]